MKIFFLITSLSLSISLFASEPKLKFENKVTENIVVKINRVSFDFNILCLNGYQYLYSPGSAGNPTQMFHKDKKSKQSVPISCNGYEDE